MINGTSPLANATLEWNVASGYTVDASTGNYIPVSSGVVYYASLKQKTNPRYDYLLGADNTAVYMEGRLTGPLALSGVSPGNSASATINGREGRFELLPNEQLVEHYWQFLGTPIRGIFRLVGKGSVLNA
ncbi:hypothetical protein UFOVP649_8 [uncultured Caudovirales phage]|uniref:Uncharacterized protein n=1 Tax=uncultured Caudovirales phage TaxID=2100421 RepID=A0A6J5NAM4_9CAUD|nr:hypothetical protein UFOVP649_8 [uncultured Caudovirales phage]